MLTKKGKDVEITEIDADNYNVPKGEEHLYHVKIEIKKFNAETGKRMSRPRIQIFGVKEYETVVKSDLIRQGYTVDVLHNPNEWMKKREAQRMAEAEQADIARVKVIEEAKAVDRESLKMEILAELKAAGIVPEVLTDKKTK